MAEQEGGKPGAWSKHSQKSSVFSDELSLLHLGTDFREFDQGLLAEASSSSVLSGGISRSGVSLSGGVSEEKIGYLESWLDEALLEVNQVLKSPLGGKIIWHFFLAY